MTELFPLNAAEVIIAPLHDPMIEPALDVTVQGCRREDAWGYILKWDDCKAGEVAGMLMFRCEVPVGRFDRVIAALTVPPDVGVTFEACLDGAWTGAEWRGTGARFEPELPLRPGMLTGIRLTLRPHAAGTRSATVSWFAMADSALRERMESARLPADSTWPGLITAEGGEPVFARGLFFDAADLPALRAKKELPGWRDHFAVLEARARRFAERVPEDDLGEFLPWSDTRYLRAREQGREPYFWEALTVGFVGLVNNDHALMRQALRYLMCMVHTTHWCQSAESRLRGSTWDQRCFLEEMTVTACATLLDWYAWALTPRAQDLVRQAIWDKGLAIIERDMMKFEYLYAMNQGPWFCRARVLGGLILECEWPRVGDYVDRAVAAQREGLRNYILPDGGTDEGVGYWSLTMSCVLPALLAYGRARKIDVRSWLPDCENFLAVMSAVKPGNVLLDGDNSTDYLVGDTVPILAGLLPQSRYAQIASACLLQERPPTYFHQYVSEGVFGFIYGPDRLERAKSIVPVFARLEHTGQLTSCRGGVRLHLTGCKARPSHSHRDKGAFTLELDGEPVLIDRGQVRYDDARVHLMRRSALHNVITLESNTDQALPTEPVIPEGHGDERTLHASIDLSHVWREHMESCRREIRSDAPEWFVVRDTGILKLPGRIAFHLHAPRPFVIGPQGAVLDRLRITAAWAEAITQSEDLIDCRLEPVYHLIILSSTVTAFNLETRYDLT